MRLPLLLLCLILTACFKTGRKDVDQPPITEKEMQEIVHHFENSPLTGRSPEAVEKVRAYMRWHEERGTDPFADQNQARLRDLENYWATWENPKLLDTHDLVYQEVEDIEPGAGDRLRAQALQWSFVQMNYLVPQEEARLKSDEYILAWEQAHLDTDPIETDPIQWVLAHRPLVLRERDAFQAQFSQAADWQARAALLNAYDENKRQQAEKLVAHQKAQRRVEEDPQEREAAQSLEKMEPLRRSLPDPELGPGQILDKHIETLKRKAEAPRF